MRRLRAVLTIGSTAAAAALFAAPAPAANQYTTTIGARLEAPDSGACAFTAPLLERTCTVGQEVVDPAEDARDGYYATLPGRVRSFSVRSGPATPGTASVQLRLRVLPTPLGVGGPAPASAFLEMPLRHGLHTFPANLPIGPYDGIGLDVRVTGNGLGEASAPIVRAGLRRSVLDEWESLLAPGEERLAERILGEHTLEVSAEVERDDRRAPRTKLTYAPRQRFAARRVVDVYVRADEKGRAFASGQIEIPATGHLYGILSDGAQVDAGVKERMRLRLERPAVEATLRALRNGQKVLAKVTVSVTDEAGNESGATVAVIRPRD